MDKNWKIPITVCWGQRDRWLSYEGVEEFCKSSGHNLVELPNVPVTSWYIYLWDIAKQ